jgi:hypothetical protein
MVDRLRLGYGSSLGAAITCDRRLLPALYATRPSRSRRAIRRRTALERCEYDRLLRGGRASRRARRGSAEHRPVPAAGARRRRDSHDSPSPSVDPCAGQPGGHPSRESAAPESWCARACSRPTPLRTWGDVTTRATHRATKLSKPQRTGPSGHGLSKPEPPHLTSFRRYRTQEVAGSSPASSIREGRRSRHQVAHLAETSRRAAPPGGRDPSADPLPGA